MSQLNFNQYGAKWVRADFHLHTKADKEFKFSDTENGFVGDYIAALKEAEIRVGVITNHNKFDREEFKALAKAGRKEGILLLPGIELSIKDGTNGIHTLVVFAPDWIANQENKDYIQNFLNVTFAGIPNYENENGRSKHDIHETIRQLDEFEKEYFLVFAHVEAKSGLWSELAGGRLRELSGHPPFRERCLGFQKVRTNDKRVLIASHLGDFYPAEVEGCDCKSIQDIGKGRQSFLKIGALTFEAVKFALIDYQHRVSSKFQSYQHSRISKVIFDGGKLDRKEIIFSPELNTLIGIRGSGKSCVVESLRYALGIELPDNADKDGYKAGSIRHALGSGGKITVFALDRHGNEYEIRRIIDQQPDVYIDGKIQPGINIRETILHKPIYFGQKDLSSKEPGFEADLVEKLVGPLLEDARRKIATCKHDIRDTIRKLDKVTNIADREQEVTGQKQDAQHRLKLFEEHKVEEKLQKQMSFDDDSRFVAKVQKFVADYLEELSDFIESKKVEVEELSSHSSKHNSKFFADYLSTFGSIKESFQQLQTILSNGQSAEKELESKASAFVQLKSGLKEEFAETERQLTEELKEKGITALEPSFLIKLNQQIASHEDELKAIAKEKTQRSDLEQELVTRIANLGDAFHEEHRIISDRLKQINEEETALKIEIGYREDKIAFLHFLKSIFKGSNVREATLQVLVNKYPDCGAIYRDFERAMSHLGSNANVVGGRFKEKLADLITFQVPNRFTIKYHGRQLKSHSLGQRASAIILFVLSQRDSDVVIIDQPEDDLDNQTIYEDVIKLVRKLKPNIQFIFATHNPNIPVLGDAEQVIACVCEEDFSSTLGSIDCPEQQEAIVTIMEGGKEAFNRRKDIYQVWRGRLSETGKS